MTTLGSLSYLPVERRLRLRLSVTAANDFSLEVSGLTVGLVALILSFVGDNLPTRELRTWADGTLRWATPGFPIMIPVELVQTFEWDEGWTNTMPPHLSSPERNRALTVPRQRRRQYVL